jgi:hypothetical protein
MNKECTPPNRMPGCSSEGTSAVMGTPSRIPQAWGTSNYSDQVMENNHAVTTLLSASSQHAFGHGVTFQGN